MASDKLVVVSGQDAVGTLTRSGGELEFRYEPTWQQTSSATPLSVSMPLKADAHGHEVVHPWLWGLLPDNERVLARWARTFHTTAKHPMGLLAAVGRDLPGQFQMLRPEGVGVDEPSGVEWLTDDDVAGLLRDVRVDQTAWLGNASHVGRWSLAGAQAKIALRRDDDRWGRPYGRSGTTHILKPAIAGMDDHDLNEHLCLSAARRCGLIAAPSSIVMVGDERAICIERYDRVVVGGGDVLRVHQEDLCQALAVHPDSKYEAEKGPGAVRIGSLLTRCMPAADAVRARERFLDALALNWLIGGTDAHAKNYALLLSGGQVRLAPLYDVASALPHPDMHPDKLRMAMRVGGKYLASRVMAEHWRLAGAQLDLDGDAAVARVLDLAEHLPEAFVAVVSDPKVAALQSPMPQRLADLVTSRCQVLARRLRA